MWKGAAAAVAARHPDIDYRAMYVDNAAMQLVRRPTQFAVIELRRYVKLVDQVRAEGRLTETSPMC